MVGAAVPGGRVATVAGRPIPVSRLEERIAELRRGPRGRHLPPDGAHGSINVRRWVVRELVIEEVLAHEAMAAGLIGPVAAPGSDSSAASDRGDAGIGPLPPPVVSSLVERVTASVTVPDGEVRAYYERNRDLYRRPEMRRIRHVLLGDQASARRLTRRLLAGDDMGQLAGELSTDAGSRTRGGDLGDVGRGELTGPLEDAIFGAEIGTVIGPIRSEHGWHVVQVEGVKGASDVPYEEVRAAIEAELLGAARTREFETWLENRRLDLAVIEPEFEHPANPVHGIPSHRH